MKKIYCDCCKREIINVELVYHIDIFKGKDAEIILDDVCQDCYGRFLNIINSAEWWRKQDESQ